ncbi:hypothetical protein ACFX2J_012787 [Malus domestica]
MLCNTLYSHDLYRSSETSPPRSFDSLRVSLRVATSMNLPLGENLAKETEADLSSISVFNRVPDSVSQILQDPSWLAETTIEPSRLKLTEVRGWCWRMSNGLDRYGEVPLLNC